MGFLTDKVVILTGGGRAVLSDGKSCGSIGYGIATAYAKEGANLVITGRNVKKLEDAKEELERLYGVKVLPVQADVAAGQDNEAVVQHVIDETVKAFGRNVNVICPIAWTAQLEGFEKSYPEAFKANVKMPPMGHYGDPELEIGRVCVQLAHPDFKYLTGETLTLEGGMGLRP